MSASCDTCRAPGNCCRGFVLNIGPLPSMIWRHAAQATMDKHGLPFRPVRVSVRHDYGPDQVAVVFDCPLLGADGRCTEYKTRPLVCHDYQAGHDALCAEFVHTLKGIPIVVA